MPAPRVGLREFALLLIVALPLVANAADDPSEIGVVDKVENEANIVSGDNATAAIIGTPVHMRDELRTGAEGRLKITFRDETVLTLGEKASVVIDRYVYDPDRQVGETILQATKGAFRFASGRIKAMKQSKIAVSTPVADIGVRGTEFWGGPIGRTIWGAAARRCSHRVQPGRQRDAVGAGTRHGHPLAARSAGRGQALGRRQDCPRRRLRGTALARTRHIVAKQCAETARLENPSPCGAAPGSLGCRVDS